MPRIDRIRTKYQWVRLVANHIHVNTLSRWFLILNGMINLVSDPVGLRFPYKVPISLNKKRVRWPFHDILDYGLAYELWVNPSYNIHHPQPSDVKHIVDIGTNNGMSALFFRSLFPKAVLHCVEPNHHCANRIEHVASEIGNLHLYQKVVADKDSKVMFFIDTSSSVSSSILQRNHRQKPHTIDAITFNTLLDEIGNEVDILKFDIEGSEELVFGPKIDLSRVHTLIGELHYDLCDASQIKSKFEAHYTYVYEQDLAKNRTLILATNNPLVQFTSEG